MTTLIDNNTDSNLKLFINRGIIFTLNNEDEKAIEDFNYVLSKDSNNEEAHLYLAFVYSKLKIDFRDLSVYNKDMPLATEHIKALATYNESPTYYIIQGNLSYVQGNIFDAKSFYEKVLEIEKENNNYFKYYIYEHLASIYYLLQDYVYASEYALKVLEVTPENSMCFIILCEYYTKEEFNLDEAYDYANKAVTLTPELSYAYYLRGKIILNKDLQSISNQKLVIDDLSTAISIHTKNQEKKLSNIGFINNTERTVGNNTLTARSCSL